ncbi:Adenylylsulfate kinase [Friedmanniella luteola]|uniref:Adenylylsulfate kinase n=1 Tax=Friedmanniella luteola TaxID=546871 RepID=A0A1H2ABX1_9ACTN|nr:adenylyl-sulfate kinase [Friedmanniella luteola]SDT43448.1 Adenylylsulfate kinase [Friedmanniella luteola]
MTCRALLLTGTVGVGKTTTADAVGDRLREQGVPHAVVDLDELRRCWPAPAGDPFHTALELRNLAAVARAYRAAGAVRLVLAGVAESRDDRERYAGALGVPLQVVRLLGAAAVVEPRLRARHSDDPEGLAWHLHRRGELDAVLDAAAVADADVRVDGLSRGAVADAVLRAAGWVAQKCAPSADGFDVSRA